MTELGMPALIELPEIGDCAGLCRELGLQFVELNMNLPQYQLGRMRPEIFREIAERNGIYYTIHLDENLNVSDFNPRVAAAWMDTVTESIGFAKKLHIPVLNMHLSRGVYFTMPDKKVFLFDVCREEYLAGMTAFRTRCEEAAGGADVKICIENSDGYTDFQIQALDILLESPVFGLTYDIGHDHATGGQDGPVVLQRGARLHHFHFHDARGKQNHLPLGTGEIDLPEKLRLAEAGNARIVLETKTIGGLRQSAVWMHGAQGRENAEQRGKNGCISL